MNNKKIIYLKQKGLRDPGVADYIDQYSRFSREEQNNFLKLCEFNGGVSGSYIRSGVNLFPTNNDLIHELKWQVPDYNPDFNMSFTDITDQRCQDLKINLNQTPWLILWSGGIDSTVIVTSILKNLAPEDLDQITIACNRVSVYENPHFFHKYIQPNFKLVNSNDLKLNKELFNTYTVCDGELADQLFASRMQDQIFQQPECLTKNIRTAPDQLLKFLSAGTFDTQSSLGEKWAVWFYETMMANIDSTNIPVLNYYDFYWWYMFNVTWAGIKIRPLEYQTDTSTESLQSYFDNVVHWFDTDEYQQWAMNNNKIGIKYGKHIGEYKLVAKQYIYEFDKNEWYFKFKTKKNSISVSKTIENSSWDCILNDFTRLTWNQNQQEILELLPTHIV